MTRLIPVLLILALANPALAFSEGKKEGHGASNRIKAEWTIKNDLQPAEKINNQAVTLHAVDIPVVVVPISINGHLVNYAFLNIRVMLKDDVNVWKLRAKSHFMRDAIIRMAHSQPFGEAGERSKVNKTRALKLISEAILPWVSESQLDHTELLSVDMLNG